jgi:predicted ATPase
MITSVRLQNFKGHKDTTVPLGRFTVLVGPNGAGKSSVLEALRIQSRIAREDPTSVFKGDRAPADLLRRGSIESLVLRTEGVSSQVNWSAQTTINITKGWSLRFNWHHGSITEENVSEPYGVQDFQGTTGNAVLYKLNARKIASAAHINSLEPTVAYDGTGTAAALAAMKLSQDEDFLQIEDDLRCLAPNVERIRVRPFNMRIGLDDVVGNKIYFDFRGASGVPAHAAGEGTLITLAILTVLHGQERPSVMLLDDFDQSLHPQAQVELVRLLKRLLEKHEDVQIVATTHSPYILDELEPTEIVVFALRADGTVATKCLSEHPQANKMKGALSAGQLWSLDPEKDWVPAEATP